MSIRRDATRPIAGLAGRTVEIWGCGGLGSWLAEFIARAGAARIVLRDHHDVGGGLLVRQNYIEDDIGANKADRLAVRLRQIADDLVVESHPVAVPRGLDAALPSCDIIIDATVAPAVGAYLDAASGPDTRGLRPLLAQVATDIRTGTLGMMTVRAPYSDAGLVEIDSEAGAAIAAHAELERFQTLWQEPSTGEELIPVSSEGKADSAARGFARDAQD